MLHSAPPRGHFPLRSSTVADKGITSRPSRRSVTASDTTKQLAMRQSRRLSPTARHTSTFPPMVRMIKQMRRSQRTAVEIMVTSSSSSGSLRQCCRNSVESVQTGSSTCFEKKSSHVLPVYFSFRGSFPRLLCMKLIRFGSRSQSGKRLPAISCVTAGLQSKHCPW